MAATAVAMAMALYTRSSAQNKNPLSYEKGLCYTEGIPAAQHRAEQLLVAPAELQKLGTCSDALHGVLRL